MQEDLLEVTVTGRRRKPPLVVLRVHSVRFMDVEWAALVEAAGGPRKVGAFIRKMVREHLGMVPEEKK
jgi:hypothetical protein